MKNEILIIGIVISFGVGFLTGSLTRTTDHGPVVIQPENRTPANYSPERAIVSDTMKQLQEANTACWNKVEELLTKQAHH